MCLEVRNLFEEGQIPEMVNSMVLVLIVEFISKLTVLRACWLCVDVKIESYDTGLTRPC